MTVAYRPAEERDVPAMSAVIAAAQNDLHARHGYQDQHMDPDAAITSIGFLVRSQPAGCFVAEDGGVLAGIGCAWVLGAFWYLADLFVEPACQGQGVGRELLARTLAYRPDGPPANRALITFAYNRVSTSLYAKHGMYPREPLYVMSCDSARITSVQRAPAEPPVELTAAGGDAIPAFRRIDEAVLGYTRDEHHAFWRSMPGMRCEALRHDGRIAGYAYVWENGRVGPLAVEDPALLEPFLEAVVRIAAARGEPVTLMAPGANARAMDVAMRYGFRIELPLVVLATEPFGRWEAYLPSSPGLL